MDRIRSRLHDQGPNPPALAKLHWKTFGDALAKDICLSARLAECHSVRAELKQAGGVVQILRNMFPTGAAQAALRYGAPSAEGPVSNSSRWNTTYGAASWATLAF